MKDQNTGEKPKSNAKRTTIPSSKPSSSLEKIHPRKNHEDDPASEVDPTTETEDLQKQGQCGQAELKQTSPLKSRPKRSTPKAETTGKRETIRQHLESLVRRKYPITPERLSELFEAIISLTECKLNSRNAGDLIQKILNSGDYLAVSGNLAEFVRDILGWPDDKAEGWLSCLRDGRFAEVDDAQVKPNWILGLHRSGSPAKLETNSPGADCKKGETAGIIEVRKTGDVVTPVSSSTRASHPEAADEISNDAEPTTDQSENEPVSQSANAATPLEDHPLASAFPLLKPDALNALADDIRRHGLKEPIVKYEGKILDGRNRYRACLKASVEPLFTEYSETTPVQFVISKNLHRRDMTAGQRATAAVELLPQFEAEAKKRQDQTTRLKRDEQGKLMKNPAVEIIPPVEPVSNAGEGSKRSKSRDEAAKLLGVNAHYVSDAKKVKETAPEIFAKLKRGEVTLAAAKKLCPPETDTGSQEISSGAGKSFNEAAELKKFEKVILRQVERWPKDAHKNLTEWLKKFFAQHLGVEVV